MRKPVIAAVIAGAVTFGGLVATAEIAQAATVSATVQHPAPSAKKPHKGVKGAKGVKRGWTVEVAKPKPKKQQKKAGKPAMGAHKG